MSAIWPNLKYTLRTLKNNWGFSLAIISILALCIGPNTAIYSIVRAVILQPLPYPDPEQLVMLPAEHKPEPMGIEVAAPTYLDWREEGSSFKHLSVYLPQAVNFTGGETPERVQAVVISPAGLFALGIHPMMGRLFLPEEEGADARVVILSHSLWKSHFGSDPDVLDKVIQLGDIGYPIVGVMPENFYFPDRSAQIYIPARVQVWAWDRSERFLYAFGRLKDGVSIDAAQHEMDGVTAALAEQYPVENTGWGTRVTPLQEHLVGKVRPTLMILLTTVVLMLLAACANVINLQLTRATTRRKEMALRSALGAPTSSLLRQLVLEGLVLAIIGGAVGLLLAHWTLRLLIAWSPSYIPRLEEVTIDGSVLLFTLGMSLLVGVICGLAPVLSILKSDLVADLREGAAASSSGQSMLLRRLLTVAEVTAAVVLMIGAGLLLASLNRLQKVDPGLNPDNVLTMEIVLSWDRYPEEQDRASFFLRLEERIRSLPGVEGVASISTLPLSGMNATLTFTVEGQAANSTLAPEAGFRAVTPGYFKTFQIPLLRGRDFTRQDNIDAPRVVLVNEVLAERYWPGQDPVGQRMVLTSGTALGISHEVIGVVGKVHHHKLDIPAPAEFYVATDQQAPWNTAILVIRSNSDLDTLHGPLRAVVKELDPKQPVSKLRTMEAVLAESISEPKLYSVLLAGFAGLAFLLSSVGIYSIISYSVAQRQLEFGIRTALGAQRGKVLSQVLRDGIQLTGLGIVLGLMVAWVGARGLANLLFEVEPNDPLIFFGTAVVLGGVAVLASLVPALRASRFSPIIALRTTQ